MTVAQGASSRSFWHLQKLLKGHDAHFPRTTTSSASSLDTAALLYTRDRQHVVVVIWYFHELLSKKFLEGMVFILSFFFWKSWNTKKVQPKYFVHEIKVLKPTALFCICDIFTLCGIFIGIYRYKTYFVKETLIFVTKNYILKSFYE